MALRCLLVDDSEEFLESARRLLTAQDVEVVGCASSPAEALRLVQALEPDVALVDIQLGREDGIELSRRLAANARGTQIILISIHDEDEVAELVAASPAAGFLPKAALSAGAIGELIR